MHAVCAFTSDLHLGTLALWGWSLGAGGRGQGLEAEALALTGGWPKPRGSDRQRARVVLGIRRGLLRGAKAESRRFAGH